MVRFGDYVQPETFWPEIMGALTLDSTLFLGHR